MKLGGMAARKPSGHTALVPYIPSKMLWQEQRRQALNSSKCNELLFCSKNHNKFTLQISYESINYIKTAVVIVLKMCKRFF